MARKTDYEMRRSGHYSSGPVQLSEDSLAAFNKTEQDEAARAGTLTREERRERRAQRDVARRKKFKLLICKNILKIKLLRINALVYESNQILFLGIILGLIIVLAVILIPIGIFVIGKQNKPSGSSNGGGSSTSSSGGASASNGGLNSINQNSIPVCRPEHHSLVLI